MRSKPVPVMKNRFELAYKTKLQVACPWGVPEIRPVNNLKQGTG